MREPLDTFQPYTKENMEAALRLWMRSSISLIDVRYRVLERNESIEKYRMPTSMFLYVCGGQAAIRLNRTAYQNDRFGLFHGGKGTELSIDVEDEQSSVYMVLYKTESPPFYKREVHRLLEQVNPFSHVYGFMPGNPLLFQDKFQSMYEHWREETNFHQLAAKIVLYQVALNCFQELGQNGIQYAQLNYVEIVKQYLELHYREPISIQQLIQMLPVSRGPLVRLFKKSEGRSLQEYLNEVRLRQAKRYLASTHATLQEIAAGCGFGDELNLIRMFKKKAGMTPSEYRAKRIPASDIFDIDNNSHRFYNEGGLDDLAKSQRDGEFTMFGQARSKQMILAAAMSLMLLLAACGTAPANTTNGAGTQNTPPAATTPQTPAVATKAEAAWPRTYVDATGEEVVIEKQPERVAVLFFVDIEPLYALGVPPIASTAAELSINHSKTLEPLRNANVIDIGDANEPNLEKLLEADPDLIIAFPFHESQRGELAKIAPVVVVERENFSSYMREFGVLLGKEERVEELIAERHAKLDEAREKLAAVDETSVILWVAGGKLVGILGKNMDVFYSAEEGLGLKAPQDLPDAYSEISLEGVAALNPDHIFIYSQKLTYEDYELTVTEFSKSSVWQSLSAVKSKQVYYLDDSMFRAGALGMPLLIDFAREKILK